MARFFRKIRYQEVLDNKFSKYILYAIGEIALVIIGILFALYINNQNELSNREAKAEILFTNILKELKTDINESSSLIDFYRTKDSLTSIVLFGNITMEDYQDVKNISLYNVSNNYKLYETTQHGYDALLQNLDQVPTKYAEAIDIMNVLYKESKTTITIFNETIHNYVLKNIERSALEHDWFSDTDRTAGIQYKLNSPKYRNEVLIYRSYALDNLVPAIKRYRLKAIEAYNHIANLLDVPTNEAIFNLSQRLPDNYLGYYYNKESQHLFKVFKKGDDTYIFYPKSNNDTPIYPYKDTVFYDINNSIYTFNTLEGNKVLSRSLSNHYTIYTQIDSTEVTSLSEQNSTEIEVSDKVLKKYIGRYELNPKMILTIFQEGDDVKAQATTQPAITITPIAKNVFYNKQIDGKITFNENQKGEIESLTLLQAGIKVEAKRLSD